MSQTISVANPTIAWTRLPDGAVLFSPSTEVYYGLNEVAALVWETLAQEANTVGGLCAAVQGRFPDVARSEIDEDVVELIGELQENGLIKLGPIESAA